MFYLRLRAGCTAAWVVHPLLPSARSARVNESKTCAVNVNMKSQVDASKPNARKKAAAGPN